MIAFTQKDVAAAAAAVVNSDLYHPFMKQVKTCHLVFSPVRDSRGGVDHFKSPSCGTVHVYSLLGMYMLLPLEK